ncbi:MAG: hypothetical protein ACQESR_16945 [Planctomycetota bacterium]
MGRCPTQAVLPLVGLAAEKVIRDRYSSELSHGDEPYLKLSPSCWQPLNRLNRKNNTSY